MKPRLIVVAIMMVLLTGSSPRAQDKSLSDQAWDDAARRELAAETATAEAALALMKNQPPKSTRAAVLDLAESYRSGSRTTEGTSGLVAKSLNGYYLQKATARTAPQVTQLVAEAQLQLSVIQIQQNQRIIALLEQLTAQSARFETRSADPDRLVPLGG